MQEFNDKTSIIHIINYACYAMLCTTLF